MERGLASARILPVPLGEQRVPAVSFTLTQHIKQTIATHPAAHATACTQPEWQREQAGSTLLAAKPPPSGPSAGRPFLCFAHQVFPVMPVSRSLQASDVSPTPRQASLTSPGENRS